MCLSLKYKNNKLIKLITVYFPCFESSIWYSNVLNGCVGFVDNAVYHGDDIILGDLNFRFEEIHNGFKYCRNVFNQLGIFNCDDLCSSNDRFTYFSNSLGHGSFIDHLFVCISLRSLIDSIHVEFYGASVSDHGPVSAMFQLRDPVFSSQHAHISRPSTPYTSPAWRWTK
jgi:hypothetical protein